MKSLLRLISSVSILVLGQPALAYIDFNAFYISDSLETTSSQKDSSMFIEGSLGFAVDKKQNFLVGWNYSMMNVTRSTTTEVKYASTQMGPRFIWRIGKKKNWSLGFGYYLLTTAKYNGSGTEVEWEGNALKVDFGYSFDISEDFQLGVRGNYSAASYNEQLVGSSTYTEVSYKRSHMYPSLYMIWVW